MNERRIDRWFAHYSDDHRNATNQRIHVFAVPLILWSVIAMLWCIPVVGSWFRPGMWAALAMFFAWSFYFRASRRIGYGMLAVFVAMAWLTRWLHLSLGTQGLSRSPCSSLPGSRSSSATRSKAASRASSPT